MRTTLDLPECLLDEAMKVAHLKTKTSVIVHALEDLIQKDKLSRLKYYQGRLKLNINLDVLRKR